MEDIQIVSYDPKYNKDFYDLNIEWLETYFYVEPYDNEVLSNPKTYIIDKGGFIFFGLLEGKVVGTVALINEEDCYELSKMAISPKFRGRKIGQLLMDHCIDFSRKQGWKKIMLYSNRILTPAINLYKKVGFEEVELEKDAHYQRANIKMILKL